MDNDTLLKIIPLIRERLVTLDDCLPFAAWFFKETVNPEPGGTDREEPDRGPIRRSCREKRMPFWLRCPRSARRPQSRPCGRWWSNLSLSPNQVFGILRVAVTGQTVSPPLFESMEIVGKEKVLERLQKAIGILEKM